MRIGYFQFSPKFLDPEANRSYLEQVLSSCNADILVLPELAVTGYLFTSKNELEACAESVDGPTSSMFQELSRKTGTLYVYGYAERQGHHFYNSAAAVDASGIRHSYRKLHLFNTEKQVFTPGDTPLDPFIWNGHKLGVLICFDHMFPEAARTLALKGAEVICHPSNLVLPEYAQLTSRVRALENRVFWVLANRTGSEKSAGLHLKFTGCSQVVGSTGKVLIDSGSDEHGWAIADVDPKNAQDKYVTQFNDVLADRRADWYDL